MTWVAVGTAAAIGAGVGAGSQLIQGKSVDDALRGALIGGATGALTGGAGAALSGASGSAGASLTTEAASQLAPELVNTAAVNAVPLDTVIQQAVPEALSSATTSVGSAGIEQITPEMMNAVNLGSADAIAAQGTGTQVAGPAMNVAPTPLPTAGAPPANVPAPETVSNFGIKGVGPDPSAVSPFDTGVKPMIQGGDARYASTMGQLQPSVTAPIAPSGPATSTPSTNPFMEGFASVKDFIKKNPLESAVIGYAGLTALDSFGSNEDPRKKKTYVNKYPISPNFQPSRPQPNVYRPSYAGYAEGGITSFDDEAGVDQFAAGGSTRKERDADADFKRYYSMMNARPEVGADEEALRKPRFARDDDADTRYQDALTAALIRQKKNNARANIGSPSVKRPTPLGTINLAPPGTQQAAAGGIMGYSLGGYAAGGNPRLLKGPGDGMSDDIPAVIGRKQPARLADGEFVVPADVVSHLGNGSTDAGAKKLHQMMDRIRTDRTGRKKQAPEVNANKYLPGKKKASGGIMEYAEGGITGYAEGGEVAALYQSVLGRAPDAAGLEFWTKSGLSAAEISKALAASPEAIVNQVYQEQVGRRPDEGGAAYYQSQIGSGKTAADIAAEINRSLEGTNFDTQTIESAYNRNLRRTAEQEGFQFWLSAAQASPMTQKQLMDAITEAAEGREKIERNIQGKTFTDLEVSDFVADPLGGRRATTSIYDIPKNETDRINISYINGIPVQFVNPVTEKALITRFGEGAFKASMGEETYSPERVAETADRAFRAGSMTKVEYDKVMIGLNGISQDLEKGKLDKATAGDSIRQLLNVPKGFKIIDPKYGQQIGEDNSMDIALAEAAKRQDELAKQDPGYYQANDILGQAYLNAGLDFPFMSSDYKANTMMTQADKLTPQNAVAKLGATTNQLRQAGPYQPNFGNIYNPEYGTQGKTPLPPSVRDPYSDEGLKILYGRMMDQYGTPPPGQVNPATLTNNPPVMYQPPPVNNLILDKPLADATKPAAATPAGDYFAAPSGQIFANEAAYNATVAPTQGKAGGLMSIKHRKRRA
jgi:hypothetical protein